MAVKPKRAVGIIRVSQVAGRDEGGRFVSPDDQRQRIEALCKSKGFKLVACFEEMDVSGGAQLDRRNGLREALELIEAGRADVLVAAYFDRLVRSLTVQQEVLDRVEAAGGEVILGDYGKVSNGTATEWASGTMVGTFAEWQRRSTGERLANNQQVAIEGGRWPVRLIPSLRKGKDGRAELDPEKAEVVKQAVALRLDGGSVEDVRVFLADHGIKRSYHGTMALLRNRQLVGEIRFKGQTGKVPRLIDDDTFRAIQKMSVARGPKPKSDRLLARLGVLRCGTCNARLVVGTSHEGATWCYRCPPFGDTCDRRMSISAHIVEPEVENWIRQELAGVQGRASSGSDVAEAKAKLDRSQAALDNGIKAITAARVGAEPSAVATLADLREQRDQDRDAYDEELDADRYLSEAVTVGDWDELSLECRRDVIKGAIKRILIHPGRGVDRIEIEGRWSA